MTCATCNRLAHRWGLCVGCALLYVYGPWPTVAAFVRAHLPPDTRATCAHCKAQAVDSGLCSAHFAEVVL